MAKRRKLEAPSADDLNRMEAEFERETHKGLMAAPIAQVAADAAGHHDPRSAEDRAAAARDKADADRLRAAQDAGLVMLEIPLQDIRRDALVRDRVVIDAAEMEELKTSIVRSGLRLPIEVFEIADGGDQRFGLLSGYRRMLAMEQLRDMWKGERFTTIKAVVRDPEAMGGAVAAMVEENEIRTNLSHYERGRIAVLSAQQGVFVNTEEAVNALFPAASKAKRSKIRSFALIFEELGDMLSFPDLIKERDGLKLATALREGHEGRLREALAGQVPETPEEEAAILADAMAGIEARTDPKRGGRPKKPVLRAERSLSTGVKLAAVEDGKGWTIRLSGSQVDKELVEVAMRELERLLDKTKG